MEEVGGLVRKADMPGGWARFQYVDKNGCPHQPQHGDPAELLVDERGVVRYAAYYRHGCRHNAFGPARIWWDQLGAVSRMEFFIFGLEVTEEQHRQKAQEAVELMNLGNRAVEQG